MLCFLSGPAWAEDWSVLAIGNPTAQSTSAFADAYHAAEALKAVSGAQVYMFRDLDADETEAVMDTALGETHVIIYFSGDITGPAEAPILLGSGRGGTGVDLIAFLDRLAQSGTETVALLLETCAGQQPTGLVAYNISTSMKAFIAVSAADCDGPRLTDVLKTDTGTSLAERVSGAQILTNTADTIVLDAPPAAPNLVPAPTAQVAEVTRVPQDVISILPATSFTAPQVIAATPAAFVETVAPSRPSADGPTALGLPTAVTTGISALPLQEGLPEPSIIVGIIGGAPEFDEVAPDLGDVSGTELSYDDIEARQNLRQNSPEVFGNLVQAGAFDPPISEMERALQNELTRMNCYRSRVDGVWGNGSRTAVDRYFVQSGDTAPTREPTPELFRVIISADDVACPTPTAVRTASPSTSQSQPTTSTAAAPTEPAATVTEEQTPSGGGLADVNFGGAFR